MIGQSHTVSVDLPQEVIDQNVIMGHSDDPQGDVIGQLWSEDSGVMFSQYQVETNRGWLFLCLDTTQSPKFAETGKLTYGSQKFRIMGAPRLFAGFGNADNFIVPLEELDV